eukprot:NODE_506_length_7505_cov_0.263705.p1 type:complete len:408 gc:universal NODE_506_length_7505_cov_0.263705:4206-2983(-)
MDILWLPDTTAQISEPLPIQHEYPADFSLDLQHEYERIISNSSQYMIFPNNDIPTYPPLLILPIISEHTVKCILPFRSNKRIPCINYIHNNVPLARSAQPRTGLTNQRNVQDEHLINLILYKDSNYIIDARPKVNVQVNQIKGLGSESNHYKGCTRICLGIDNIHKMRDSYSEIISNLSSINLDMPWFHHLSKILRGSALIVYALNTQEIPCLIHCSDGWDRTPQLTALSMLCLDSYYRDLTGFLKLIEIEFGYYSHKFKDRLGYTELSENPNKFKQQIANIPQLDMFRQRSPILIQFIWCVYLLKNKYPTAFTFDSDCLMHIIRVFHKGYKECLANKQSDRKPDASSMYDDILYFYKDKQQEITNRGILDPGQSDIQMWNELYIKLGYPVNVTAGRSVMSYPMEIK